MQNNQGQVPDDEKQRQLEDAVINDFIEEELPFIEPIGDPSVYEDLKPNFKHNAEIASFRYFNKAYETKQEENPKYTAIPFENFLKIYRPEKDLNNSPGSDGRLYKEIFGSDTGTMKFAALQGYKRIIAEYAE